MFLLIDIFLTMVFYITGTGRSSMTTPFAMAFAADNTFCHGSAMASTADTTFFQASTTESAADTLGHGSPTSSTTTGGTIA
ncbi:hypothetical protein GUJ93_ZPchr0015g6746 [Zizania palustris]|uniref:Secreted protein n=1 Tax=Zizania palustris TaxID=103762 RepID=A0A8J5T8Z1_ZIZPA|nr:hypothetical protein GUJ93_ZPchr0015g6746 [Zizania palustris]